MSAVHGLFKKNKNGNRIFVETGCYEGNGIQQALNEGFEVAYSIEVNPKFYLHCTERFKDNPNVKIILGDAAVMFPIVMSLIDEPCTLWLDAHEGGATSTLLAELEALKNHPIKTHTILIDDMRMWKMKTVGFTPQTLVNVIMDINEDYIVRFVDGGRTIHKAVLANDILVATCR